MIGLFVSLLLFPLKSEAATHHDFINLTPSEKVEYYWSIPEGKGPFPLLVYLHGHQEGSRPGAKQYVNWGVLDEETKKGHAAVAISQAGYGESNGAPDFCGPRSQAGARAIIEVFKKNPLIDSKHIILQGVSRGAIIASMILTQDQTIAGAILISGFYDIKESLNKLPALHEEIEKEIGDEPNRYSERSALNHVNQITTPVLLLNGETDDRTFPDQAKELAQKLSQKKIKAQAIIFPNTGHLIPLSERAKYTDAFIKEILKH